MKTSASVFLFLERVIGKNETYQNCPLWQKYEREKKLYLKECKKEQWRKYERWKLMGLIIVCVNDQNPQKRRWWIRQLNIIFQRKLQGLKYGEDWIEFLAYMNDNQICGKYRHPKYVRYFIAIRDKAREISEYHPEKKGIIIWNRGNADVYEPGRTAEEIEWYA